MPDRLAAMRRAVGLTVCCCAASTASAQGAPRDTAPTSLLRSAIERDTASRLGAARLAALSSGVRAQWTDYVGRSRAHAAADRAVVARELAAAGVRAWTAAPYTHAFSVTRATPAAWFGTPEARTIAENVLTYQTPSGGWSKHVDVAAGPRRPGQSYFSESTDWQYIGTFDNDATTSELRVLGGVDAVHRDARYEAAFLRGVSYVLDAQYPNGCWPQVYPLQGGYHDAATFNDDAFLNNVYLLQDVARGAYPFVAPPVRASASASVDRAVGCIVASQVRVAGAPTIWGQQHDPLTLAPVRARSYEPASLAPEESAHLVDLLMGLDRPAPAVVRAVQDAARWLERTPLHGLAYGHDEILRPARDTAALWPRMAELATGRPVFSNRDGVILYDWNRLTDRRHGYRWFTADPAATLARYRQWSSTHPHAESSPSSARGN